MATLSSKDKLTLKLSAQRVERWNCERMKPAKDVSRCKGIVFAPGQEKESLEYGDKDVIVSSGDKMRNADAKTARQFVRRHMGFSDYTPDASEIQPIGAGKRKNKLVYVVGADRASDKPNKASAFKKIPWKTRGA